MRSASEPSRLVVTTTRLPEDLLERFRAVAEGDHRSVSQQLRMLVDDYVRARELKEAA